MALGRKNRLAVLAAGPLLHRVGQAAIPAPGGDRIGRVPSTSTWMACSRWGVHRGARRSYYLQHQRAARRDHRAALPQRDGHGDAADRGDARQGRDDHPERGDRAGDHRPHQVFAEDGRDHRAARGPQDRDRGRGNGCAARSTGCSATATRPSRWPSPPTSRMAMYVWLGRGPGMLLTFLNTLYRVGLDFAVEDDAHPLLWRRRRPRARSRWRPTCIPAS